MLFVKSEDIKRLAHDIRLFLNKGDLLTRLSVMPTLYLEFPDVGVMHDAHRSILQALSSDMINTVGRDAPYDYIDDHTIRMQPLMGVVIVLSCKQRFATKMGGSVGYRDIAFQTVELPKRD